jgi:hypothetical protein
VSPRRLLFSLVLDAALRPSPPNRPIRCATAKK